MTTAPTPAAGGMPTGRASLAGAKRRFSRNAVFNVVGFLTQIISAFVVTPLVVHGLGNLQYGIWTLIGQAVTSMDLLDFGMGITITRFLAHHHARDDREEMNRLMSTGAAFSLVPVVLVSLGGVVLAIWAPHLFHFPSALNLPVRATIVMIALSVAAMFPGAVLSSAIPALSRYDLLTLRNTLWIVVRAVLYYLALRRGYGLVGMAAVTLGVELLALGFGVYLSQCLIPWLRLSLRHISRATLRSLVSFSAYAFLLSISVRVIFACDNIVVGWALGPLAVAFYAVAGGLADQLRSSLKIVTTLYAPLAAQIHALEGQNEMRRLFVAGSRAALMLVLPGCLGLSLLGPVFLQLWLGEAYRLQSSAILVLLTMTVCSFALAMSCTQVLYGMNRHSYNAWVCLAEAVANLGLSLLLVHRMHAAIGVAWGTAIPAVLFEAVVMPVYTLRLVGLRVVAYYRRVLLRPLLVGAPLAAWCWWWRVGNRIHGWPALLSVAAGGLLIFAVALRAYGIERGERQFLQHALRGLSPRGRWLLAGAPV